MPEHSSDDLQPLWTRGLLLLKPHVPRDEIIHTVQHTLLDLHHREYCAAVDWTRLDGGCIKLHVHESIFDWFEVEQDELMLFAALITNLWLRQGLYWVHNRPSDTQLAMCRLVGCAPSDAASPSERWRLMAAKGIDVSEATLRRFPTECRVCQRFVNSDEPDSRAHALCRVYVRTVIIPQLQEAARSEKIVAAAHT